MARATDASGETQPFTQEWNPSGYGWNVVQRVGVNVSATPQAIAAVEERRGGGAVPDSYKEACMTCHQDDVIRQQRLTKAQWDRELTKMSNWGAPVTPENHDAILNFLAQQYGPRPR
jgi:hypothetical protein